MIEKTKLYAVIGDPIKHSKSPLMHNAAFKALKMNAEYKAIHVPESELGEFVDYAKNNLEGFNVTVPHKKNIIQYLDYISDECKVTQSVNTISVKNGKLYGESTDGYGLEAAVFEAFSVPLQNNDFLFLGAGGTVNAVSYHFLNNGAESVFIVNRTLSKAEAIIERLKQSFPQKNIRCAQSNDLDTINEMLDSVKVVIQATSLGLNDSDPSPMPKKLMRPNICMFDAIYKITKFLQDAEKSSCPISPGHSMLIHQGAKSFEIWTGTKPNIEVMRQALE
jgi:shikimate dehydrogenase